MRDCRVFMQVLSCDSFLTVIRLLAFSCFFLCHAALGGESRTSGLIAEGTRWETRYHVIEGAEPGPTMVLVGGVHGDEPAGAGAAEQIRHWPILKGRLVVIPRANMKALAAHSRLIPEVEKEVSDLNRDFPKPGGANEASGELASVLWSFVASQKPDWLIDMHEGFGFHQKERGSVGSSIIDSNGTSQRMRWLRPCWTRSMPASRKPTGNS